MTVGYRGGIICQTRGQEDVKRISVVRVKVFTGGEKAPVKGR
jgi:hypothetical protein